ncbi:M28 family peptidase [Pedobacter sp.]|uniref:M28 family peptidase n=1 Tax=Pedobacter sp. TaxID=1411316 RepID=UPI00396CC803
MKTRILITAFSCMVLAKASFAQERISKEVATALELASAKQIKADITYLADDKLLGRKPGTPGYKMAVDYVIEELKKNGVKPAGENGTWLQTILMRSATIEPDFTASLYSSTSNENLAEEHGITLSPNPVASQASVDAAVVFVGYGITAPTKNYDDYKDLNVKGKIVLVLRGAPESFSSSEASASMNIATIQKNALQHGAIGVIMASAVDRQRNVPAGAINRPSIAVMTPKGELVVSSGFSSKDLKIAGTLGFNAVKKIFNSAEKDISTITEKLKKGETQSFATNYKIKASYKTSHNDFITYNVAGKIEGSDPKLKKEYVVHSAHLDHLGISKPIEGDSIYNGAHDNASGVASLLQITKIYSGLKAKPKRSVLILMVTGEEMGLLGSSYFALKPTVNINQIVANVNTDMPTIIAPLLSITALGAEHSTLINPVNEAASYMGLTVEPDPEPNENRFVRSDQYSFIKEGIPALHVKYGNKTADGKNNLDVFVKEWRAKYYHKPQDDINGIFDFDAGRKYAQLNFLIGYLVANDIERPHWNPGDIFEKKK